MIDIHAHIIPFVDDGSKSLEDSVRLIEEEINQGVTEIICTPHFDLKRYTPSIEDIKKNFELLNDEVKRLNLKIKLSLGQEICYSRKLDFFSMLKNNELLTLKETNYILMEFSFVREPENIAELMYNVKINGYRPIIAHVERYEWMNEKTLKAIISEGCLIQVNANSLIDCKDKSIYKKAKTYVKKHYVNFIASDIHEFRTNVLKSAMKKYGKYLNVIEI